MIEQYVQAFVAAQIESRRDDRYGSLAAAAAEICGARFAPEGCRDGHRLARPLRVNNGLTHHSKKHRHSITAAGRLSAIHG
jgi:hypothetical protein